MRVVWHCEDRAGPAMAGPAIRAVELAARLARTHEVTLACPGATALPDALRAPPGGGRALRLAEHAGGSLTALAADADVLVTQGFGFPGGDLARLPPGLRLVLDLYDPVQLELLSRAGGRPTPEQLLHLAAVRWRLLALLARADHVLCASERQRAFWLGWLGAAGRLSPGALGHDPEARALLAVVPFGVPGAPPAGDDGAAARLLARASRGEPALLWWGGLWDWMDPITAVRAVKRLRAAGLRATLVLPAGNRPGAAPMAMDARAEQEARLLGLWGDGVGRLPAWLPYAERGALLGAAAAAVSCHRPSLEADLAFRTRLLDCLWAGLPFAATAGDELSERADREGWGRAVPPGDADALAHALAELLRPEARAAMRASAAARAPAHSWDAAAARLAALLEQPPPPRPPAVLPELRGAHAGALVRTATRKVWARLRGRK